MTDRFRYLPCALHPALHLPPEAPGLSYTLGPKESVGRTIRQLIIYHLDLAHPAGWDHAVRAYVAICGGTVGESKDVRFDVFCADDGWEPDGYNGETIPGRRIPEVPMNRWYEPAGRREALCRCIFAALGVDVDQVFPLEKA